MPSSRTANQPRVLSNKNSSVSGGGQISQRITTSSTSGRRQVQRGDEERAANEFQPDMGEVVPPSEELLNLAVQGLLLLGESQAQLPTYEMSHDMHANDDVQIEQTEREQLRGGAHGVGTPDSDKLAPSSAEDVTIGGPEMRPSGVKDPPWLPDPSLVHPCWWEDARGQKFPPPGLTSG